MVIRRKVRRGYEIDCNADCRKAHASGFVVANLGVSVECPRCGRTALSTDLISDFLVHQNDSSIAA